MAARRGPARPARVGTIGGVPSFTARVDITHLPGVADPAGATVERALPALGYTNVSQVHVGKTIRLVVDAPDADAARAQVEEMCERLLANPVIEAYEVTVT
ncbi:MAG: phosphoribosylformylglycinamidine synthase subunit PurS [Acidimicrobiia bacterium]|nr:MAG: phosphoribosylformylglycinamidine synthase subunit PurS [Acidimicrobiia bacterium]